MMIDNEIILGDMEQKAKYSRSRENMRAKWLPNGNLRFYTNDARKSGCGELQCNHMKNCSDTVICAHPLNVIIEYGRIKF